MRPVWAHKIPLNTITFLKGFCRSNIDTAAYLGILGRHRVMPRIRKYAYY
jgi:hypothetical protein